MASSGVGSGDDDESEERFVSDVSQGPGWWRASDGLYYPPEARPADDPTNAPPAAGDPTNSPPHPDDGTTDVGGGRNDAGSEPDVAPTDLGPAGEPTTVTAVPPFGADGRQWGDDVDGELHDDGLDRDLDAHDLDAHEVDADDGGRRGWLLPALVVLALLVIGGGVAAWLLLSDDDDEPDVATPTSTTTDDTDATTTTDPDDVTTTTLDDDEVSAFDLGEGDCFDLVDVDDGAAVAFTTVQLVVCDDEHQAEIFAIEMLDTPVGEAFPGTEARDQAAQALCEPGFEEFLGVPLAESELLLIWLAPTDESWDDDDREVACAVAAPEGESLTGTTAGAAR